MLLEVRERATLLAPEPTRRRLVGVALLVLAALTLLPRSSRSFFAKKKAANVFGTCASQPSVDAGPLRWDSNAAVADDICCFNNGGAEYARYWMSETSFPRELPEGVDSITFFDVATGLPVFVAPRGRSYAEFWAESYEHGWPSFRDPELVTENVRVLADGEVISINGTHLGDNLPEIWGRNRYCINLVCVAGRPGWTLRPEKRPPLRAERGG